MDVQFFGLKSSPPTRAAQRFFKERRLKMHFINLAERPMSPGEINRFIQKFGLLGLIDKEGRTYQDGGFEFLKLSEAGWLERIAVSPALLHLPLVRRGNVLAVGHAPEGWLAMLTEKR